MHLQGRRAKLGWGSGEVSPALGKGPGVTPVPSFPNIARLRSTTSHAEGLCREAWSWGAAAESSPLHKRAASGLMHVLAGSIAGSLFMSTMFKSHARLSGALRTIYTGKEMSFSLPTQHPRIGVAGYKVLIENENTRGCFLGSSSVSGRHRYSTGKKWAGKGLGSRDRRLSSTTTNGPETQQTGREAGLRLLRLMVFQTEIYSFPGKNLCTSREERLGAAQMVDRKEYG